ncbi:RES family NAD+ phosphorylase [Pseudomonas sp. P5_152]|uniref:RES family NAD+ phosphorylase n=1 Tax=Pseudomonas sp. P5_152 TaxID=3043442 RepID=UPI002A364855|nr:RES family NAD+ phosphorylase [Pseudomonas sp. P5_152]MDX9668618.1 RES family NAD+ phosphorylase [Pseudomonas sp. P5_152]
MTTVVKQHKDDVLKQAAATLAKYPELIREIAAGVILHRKQPSEHDDSPVYYNPDSDTRYSDSEKKVGVMYLGFSKEVALAESFQAGQGVDDQPVTLSALASSSLHQLRTARILYVVDVAGLANRMTHHKLRDIVQAKGQGKEGYALTREFSRACMQLGMKIDGILYPSAVYSVTGSMDGCNLVLFAGRGTQVEPIDHIPVTEVVLSNGDIAVEFLDSLGVALE